MTDLLVSGKEQFSCGMFCKSPPLVIMLYLASPSVGCLGVARLEWEGGGVYLLTLF